MLRRGWVWLFDVPADGLLSNETRNSGDAADKPRPWLIVGDRGRKDGVVTAVPLTTQRPRNYRAWHVELNPSDYEHQPTPPAMLMAATSYARVDQMRALDLARHVPHSHAKLKKGPFDKIVSTCAEYVHPSR